MNVYIDPTADVQTSHVGPSTRIWQFVVVLAGARIGADVNICSHCFIESDVVIGDRVTIKSGVQLWDGLRVGDDVFIGPNVVFLGSDHNRNSIQGTRVGARSFIGAGVNVAAGITIGCDVIVGANSFVNKNLLIPGTYVGCPAKKIR